MDGDEDALITPEQVALLERVFSAPLESDEDLSLLAELLAQERKRAL